MNVILAAWLIRAAHTDHDRISRQTPNCENENQRAGGGFDCAASSGRSFAAIYTISGMASLPFFSHFNISLIWAFDFFFHRLCSVCDCAFYEICSIVLSCVSNINYSLYAFTSQSDGYGNVGVVCVCDCWPIAPSSIISFVGYIRSRPHSVIILIRYSILIHFSRSQRGYKQVECVLCILWTHEITY